MSTLLLASPTVPALLVKGYSKPPTLKWTRDDSHASGSLSRCKARSTTLNVRTVDLTSSATYDQPGRHLTRYAGRGLNATALRPPPKTLIAGVISALLRVRLTMPLFALMTAH